MRSRNGTVHCCDACIPAHFQFYNQIQEIRVVTRDEAYDLEVFCNCFWNTEDCGKMMGQIFEDCRHEERSSPKWEEHSYLKKIRWILFIFASAVLFIYSAIVMDLEGCTAGPQCLTNPERKAGSNVQMSPEKNGKLKRQLTLLSIEFTTPHLWMN